MGSTTSTTSHKRRSGHIVGSNVTVITEVSDLDDDNYLPSSPKQNGYPREGKPQQGRPPVQTHMNLPPKRAPARNKEREKPTASWPEEKAIKPDDVIHSNSTSNRVGPVTVSAATIGAKHSNGNDVNSDMGDEERRLQQEQLRILQEERLAREKEERERKARALEEHQRAIALHEKLSTKRGRNVKSGTGNEAVKSDNSAGANSSTDLDPETEEDNEEEDVQPPTLCKKDILPDIAVMKNIDAHVAKANKSLRAYLPNLVEYLVQPTKNKLEQVRAFYRWLTLNISFDMFTNEEGHYDRSTEPPAVLLDGSTNSLGFARLMNAFCLEVGIRCAILFGYTKGFSYRLGDKITTDEPPDHVWNAVQLGRDWFFIDTMWGTGNITESGEFVRRFSEFYFLTDPEKFIHTHYPFMNTEEYSKKWQLLDRPLSLGDFSNKLKLEIAALDWGVEPLSHKKHLIYVRRQVDVVVRATDVPIDEYSVQLYQENFDWTLDEYVLTYKTEENTLRIHIELPREEDYILKIFGLRRGNETSDPQLLVQYFLSCSEVHREPRVFPYHYRIYGAVPDYQLYGFQDDIWRNVEYFAPAGEATISLMCKADLPIMIKLEHMGVDMDLDPLSMVNGSGVGAKKLGFRDFLVRLPIAGYYKFTLFGMHPETDNYRPALTYLIDCRSPCPNCVPFPKVFPSVLTYRCKLLEPLTRELPANTRIKVRVMSELLREVRVMDLAMHPRDYKHFEGYVTTPDIGQPFTILGAERVLTSPFVGLFHFTIV